MGRTCLNACRYEKSLHLFDSKVASIPQGVCSHLLSAKIFRAFSYLHASKQVRPIEEELRCGTFRCTQPIAEFGPGQGLGKEFFSLIGEFKAGKKFDEGIFSRLDIGIGADHFDEPAALPVREIGGDEAFLVFIIDQIFLAHQIDKM